MRRARPSIQVCDGARAFGYHCFGGGCVSFGGWVGLEGVVCLSAFLGAVPRDPAVTTTPALHLASLTTFTRGSRDARTTTQRSARARANTKRVGHDNIPTWGSMLTEIDLASGLHIYAHNDTGNGSFFNDLDM